MDMNSEDNVVNLKDSKKFFSEEKQKDFTKTKMINFGSEFEEWDTVRKIAYLKKLASSMNQAADLMQQERNELAEKLRIAKEQVVNANQNVLIQKSIVIKAITDNNAAKEDFIDRIQELERKVKDQEEVIEIQNTRLKNISK
jgi:hypothetical protein